MVWGFTKHGNYTSQSGYKLLQVLYESNEPSTQALPPVEKSFWKKMWRLKTLPKLKHFMWKAIAGALPVKAQLASRSIHIDQVCPVCGVGSETICHLLFNCAQAKEIWTLLGIIPPAAGFSNTSVYLNMYHLFNGGSNGLIGENLRRSLPWILWQLWKARNALVFEQVRYAPAAIIEKAVEDADIWFQVMNLNDQSNTVPAHAVNTTDHWKKPNPQVLKCNIGATWSPLNGNCGISWLTRNHDGSTIFHGRRSFVEVQSLMEAELLGVLWAVESMRILRQDRIIFESSFVLAREALLHPYRFPQLKGIIDNVYNNLKLIRLWSLEHSSLNSNFAAMEIAKSVMSERRFQSYIARGGPCWLRHILRSDAAAS